MHKHLLTIALACLALVATAQQPWNFATINEAYRGQAYLIDPSAALHTRLVQVTKGAVQFNTVYHLSGPYRRMGKNYMRFQTDSLDFLVPEALATDLLPSLVSVGYWQQRFADILQWTYVEMNRATLFLDVDTTDHRYPNYTPIQWLGYRFQPSAQWPVVFTVATNTRHPQTLTQRAMERLAEWAAFSTPQTQLAYEHHQAELAAQTAQQQAQLKAQLDSLSAQQDIAARLADSLLVALRQDSLDEQQARLKAEVELAKERMNRDEIFLMSVNTARSDYMFGLEFNLYNCFAKTITKIELNVTPYNARGGVQEDKFHRSVRSVRCMGPIRPGSPAQYTFDELFWAEGDKIKYMRVTSITFHFTDGTHRTYNGYDRIMRHSLQ